MPVRQGSVVNFCKAVLPLLHASTDGKRVLEDVRAVVATDRWNSFDRFRETTGYLVSRFEESGAKAEVHTMRTGGSIGSGRWIIHRAADVRSATMDVIHPVKKRILDYSENPWHVIQWSGATPPGGMENELVVVDTREDLSRIPRGGLGGRVVLTRMDPRGMLRSFAEAGAAAVVTDHPVPNLPDATAWTKFGWGGVPIQDAAIQMVGLVLSENQGKRLRGLLGRHGSLTVRTDVDIRHYAGTHDQVSGVVPGAADPQDEVWALAHSAEPGAIDNASGVALCLEIARVLEQLIAAGKLPRPRRTIRLLCAYECHGFFKYLEDTQRLQTPLAGVVIDSVGSKPSVCGGRIEWHATIPMSAGFVDRLGETILTETLRLRNPGYRLFMEPFQPTSDTLIGDPKYGFPCPWLTTHHHKPERGFDAYHSSADTPNLLSTRGLAACATAMAGYLYWLADAGTQEILDVAAEETARTVGRLTGESASVAQAEYEREQHRVILEKLERWMWGGERRDVLARFADHEREVREAARSASRGKRRTRRRRVEGGDRIPRRTRLLSPIGENTPPEIAGRINGKGLSAWALFWADGNRTLHEISQAVASETGNAVRIEHVIAYFEAHAELGYVELIEESERVTREFLMKDLAALGLARGMDIMVHSSLSSIGHVVGGADTVIEALLAVIGKRGTLMMPSFNHRAAQVYNPMTTPTTNGAIPDAFWRRPDAVRSDHPTHAVAAVGPRAEAFCRDHSKKGLWTPDSPIGQFVHGNGHIVLLGVDHNATTAYHVAELSVPCGCIDPFGNTYRVVSAGGNVQRVPGLAFRSALCPVPPGKLNRALDRRGWQRRGRVGKADSIFVPAIEVWKARRDHLRRVCPACDIKPAIVATQA
ncbi:MAG: AAC(3) family N-acetyltransferase [Gemmatimonadota bacterium]|nr:AAC(3) family N-acetyltransferase [Gemmatimonadota bacterium]